MLDSEIKTEIARLEKQIYIYHKKIKNAKNEQNEIEDSISNLQKRKNEVEQGLNQTFEIIKRRFEALKVKASFKENHYTEVKNIIFGSSSSSVVASIQESLAKAKNKYFELDDDIDEYYKIIKRLENEIYDLKSRLNEAGVCS